MPCGAEDGVVLPLRGVLAASQHGLDPGQQLPGRVRLGDVVVGTELQAQHLVELIVLGGQHDDRHAGAAPDLAAHLGAAHPGEHEVQQHQVGAVGGEDPQPIGAVVRHRDLITLLP